MAGPPAGAALACSESLTERGATMAKPNCWPSTGPWAGPVEVHVRARMEPVRLARPVRRGRQGRLPRASACGTPTSRTSSRRSTLEEMKRGLRRRRARVPRGRVPRRLLRRPGRAGARRVGPRCASSCSRPPRRSTPTTSRSATSPARRASSDRLIEEFADAVRGRGQPHRRHGRLRVHAVRRQRQHARHGARARARGRPRQRRRSRSTPGTWASSGSRPTDLQRIPPEYLAWVELSDGQFENMDDPIDEIDQPPPAARRGRVRHPGLRRGVPARSATTGPWGVEVLSEELRNLPIDEEFKRAYETTAAQFRAGVT